MIQVVDRIIEIEKSNRLYELIDDKGIPVWDILRYDVIKAIDYKYNPNRDLLPKSSKFHKLNILLNGILALIKLLTVGKKRVLFYSHSRYKNSKGKLYDRIANDLIERVSHNERIVFDARNEDDIIYRTYTLPIGFFYALNRHALLDRNIGGKIVEAVNAGFQDDVISFSKIQSIYRQFTAQVCMFDWLLKKTKPEKIFISYGRFKPLCFSARKAGIPTWLMQHSLIEKDDATIAGTCPNKQFGINADTLLTFGSYWGDYLKHLMDIKVLGNRFLNKDGIKPCYDGSIVVVSSLYQGPYLSTFFVDFALKHKDLNFIYKLHPGERSYFQQYQQTFKRTPNVRVILDEKSMDDLLLTCSLVVLVSSTTFYEALNIKKCVAIYNIAEFESITRFLLQVPNSYPFTTASELETIIKQAKFDDKSNLTFFEALNEELALQLVD